MKFRVKPILIVSKFCVMLHVVVYINIIIHYYKYSDDIIKLPHLPECKITLI